tara:strand:- start:374 stop:493 length:120 start_codon:yes stop_codon:yes gene_type:complete
MIKDFLKLSASKKASVLFDAFILASLWISIIFIFYVIGG